MATYSVTAKRLIDGQWYIRCPSAPNGLAETQAGSRDEALEKMRQKIRYQLELCPCSAVADDYVKLDVSDVANGSPR